MSWIHLCEKITLIDIHWCLLNVYWDQTVDMSTVGWWIMYFSCSDYGIRWQTKFRMGLDNCQCTNEEYLSHFIHTNQKINARNLYLELNIGFRKLKMMSGYYKVCARWVTQIHTHNLRSYHHQIWYHYYE